MPRAVWSCCIVALLLLSGCGAVHKTPVITITGTLIGQILPETTFGIITTGPIPGTVVCNNHQTQTDATGSFTLTVPQVAHFACMLSGSQSYVSAQVDFDLSELTGKSVVLRFATEESSCYLHSDTEFCSPLT